MDINAFGAFCFGIVTGYITYRTLARTVDKAAVSDLTAVAGVLGGAAVTKLFDPESALFGFYSIGLLLGMAVFFVLFLSMNGKVELGRMMEGARINLRADANANITPGPRP